MQHSEIERCETKTKMKTTTIPRTILLGVGQNSVSDRDTYPIVSSTFLRITLVGSRNGTERRRRVMAPMVVIVPAECRAIALFAP